MHDFSHGALSAFTFAESTPVIVVISPAGIASGLAFGTPVITPGATLISPTGLPSTAAFGTPAITPGAALISPTGLPSATAFGSSRLRIVQQLFDAFGCRGIGVVQGIAGADYPLVGPASADLRYLLADAYLAYDDQADYGSDQPAYALPLRIRWTYISENAISIATPVGQPEPTHDADIIIVDANDDVVFDSTLADAYAAQDWGDRLRIHSWESADAVCRIVQHTRWSIDRTPTPVNYTTHIVPENAILDERTVERMPKRVRSLRVILDQLNDAGISLAAGNNMSLAVSQAPAGNRLVNSIELAAVPGAGTGIYPGCVPEATVLKRINNVQPTGAGDFSLAATDCYYVRQPTTVVNQSPRETDPIVAMLQFGNDCGPCCPCDDYVTTAERMNDVSDVYRAFGQEARRIRDVYYENRDRWQTSQSCLSRKPLRLAIVPQLCPYLDVGLQFCNQSNQCLELLELTVDFSGTALGALGLEVPGFTFITGASFVSGQQAAQTERYVMDGGWPVFRAYWDNVQPYSSVSVRFRLEFNNCGMGDEGAYVISAELTGTLADSPILITDADGNPANASASKLISLNCPATPDDTKVLTDCAP